MDKSEIKTHHNKLDILQRLMAAGMKNHEPLGVFGVHTPNVKEVLPAELPDLQTKDNKADTFYLLEDGTYLHVEFQTTATSNDPYRFAAYVLGLYNNVNNQNNAGQIQINSYVIYAPHVKENDVISHLDIGALTYHFKPIYLREVAGEEKYHAVIDKIRGNPKITLTPEEKMILIYRPLFNDTNEEIEKHAYFVVKDVQELADEETKGYISGAVYVLAERYLSQEFGEKIWEVLGKMNIVEREMQKKFDEGVSEGIDRGLKKVKQRIFDQLVDAIKEGEPERSIRRLIISGDFSDEEVQKAYRQAEQL